MNVFDNPDLFYRISKAVFALGGIHEGNRFNNAFQLSATKDYDYVVDGQDHVLFVDRQDLTLAEPIYSSNDVKKKVGKFLFSVPGLFIFRCSFDIAREPSGHDFHVMSNVFRTSEVHLATGASTETINHHIMMLALMLDLS